MCVRVAGLVSEPTAKLQQQKGVAFGHISAYNGMQNNRTVRLAAGICDQHQSPQSAALSKQQLLWFYGQAKRCC